MGGNYHTGLTTIRDLHRTHDLRCIKYIFKVDFCHIIFKKTAHSCKCSQFHSMQKHWCSGRRPPGKIATTTKWAICQRVHKLMLREKWWPESVNMDNLYFNDACIPLLLTIQPLYFYASLVYVVIRSLYGCDDWYYIIYLDTFSSFIF